MRYFKSVIAVSIDNHNTVRLVRQRYVAIKRVQTSCRTRNGILL